MSEAPVQRPPSSAMERAEKMVDRMAQGIGRATALAGLSLLRISAFAWEEAEDMWAEAQSIRREKGGKSG
jgi:hypothetical protein